MPNTIARVALFRDSVAKPLGGPVVEVCAVAKRDLKAGEVLDDYGMYMTYGEAVNADEMCSKHYLPEGLVEDCVLLGMCRKIPSSPTKTSRCRRTAWVTSCARNSTVTSAARPGWRRS